MLRFAVVVAIVFQVALASADETKVSRAIVEHYRWLQTLRCGTWLWGTTLRLPGATDNEVMLGLVTAGHKFAQDDTYRFYIYLELIRDAVRSNPKLAVSLYSRAFDSSEVPIQCAAAAELLSNWTEDRQRIIGKLLENPRRKEVRDYLCVLIKEDVSHIEIFGRMHFPSD